MSRVKKVLIIAPSIKAESKEVAEDIEKYLGEKKILQIILHILRWQI